jgi:hypothetical protein
MITNEKLRWLSGQTRSRVARSSDAGLYRPRCGRADRPGAHAGCHFCDCLYEYAVRAFELNAVDYLLKPYDNERLHGSIRRARERIAEKRQANLSAQLQALLDSRAKKWPERIVVKDGERFDFVPVESIDWIESPPFRCRRRLNLQVAIATRKVQSISHDGPAPGVSGQRWSFCGGLGGV